MALKTRVTRGLTTSPASAASGADETRFIAALRNRPTRSLSTEEREKIAAITSSKPKIDLEINFEFNSAVIGSKALPQATELGKALTSADLNGRTFILAGFTDAKGSLTQSVPVGATRGCGEAVPIAEVRHRGEPSGDCRVRPVTPEESSQSFRRRESSSAGDQRHRKVAGTPSSSHPCRPLSLFAGAGFLTPSAVG